MENNIKMGTLPEVWNGTGKKSQTITFCLTEECNLRCKYCYMVKKNNSKKMTFDIAKRAIDYILTDKKFFSEDGVVWDFIGGEPFLEIELIDEITDYLKKKMYLLKHPWFDNYRLSFSSNGILYDQPKVQEYIRKNKKHVYVGLSVDGNKKKHDLQRIKIDGSGSYDDVVRNVPLWIKQFPNSLTKATFAHEDLPYLKDSIISLWNLGIKTVAANVVFEDVWIDGDDIIFENQLKQLGDYVIENKLWEDYSVRFFDPSIGFPMGKEEMNKNFCGSGQMLAIDCEGNFYPCIRFLDFSLENKKGRMVGNINNGIDYNKIRPFLALTLENQSKDECLKCEVASGCSACTGFNYDCSDTGTIYERATYICKMHKANVRAVEYFWSNFEKNTGIQSPRKKYINVDNEKQKFLMMITSDDVTPHCNYETYEKSDVVMEECIFNEGIKFCEKNGYIPVILKGKNGYNVKNEHEYMSISDYKGLRKNEEAITIYNNANDIDIDINDNCILLVNKLNLNRLTSLIINLAQHKNRINIILQDIEKWTSNEIFLYEKELDKISKFVIEQYRSKNLIEINVLTDIFDLTNNEGCGAGEEIFSLAPNGKIYICPAVYFNTPNDFVGDLKEGIKVKDEKLLFLENCFLCKECESFHCRRCKYLNKKLTGEINIPSKIQCKISHIEQSKSRELQQDLIKNGLIKINRVIPNVDYFDELEKKLAMEGEVLND